MENDAKLLAENQNLKNQIQDLQKKVTEMLNKKNQEASELSQKLAGSKKDSDMQVVELESKLMLIEEEKNQAIEAQNSLRKEL